MASRSAEGPAAPVGVIDGDRTLPPLALRFPAVGVVIDSFDRVRRLRPWLRVVSMLVFPLLGAFGSWQHWSKVSELCGSYRVPLGGREAVVVIEAEWGLVRHSVRVWTDLPTTDPLRQTSPEASGMVDLAVDRVLEVVGRAHQRVLRSKDFARESDSLLQCLRGALASPDGAGGTTARTWDKLAIFGLAMGVAGGVSLWAAHALDRRYGRLGDAESGTDQIYRRGRAFEKIGSEG